MLQQFKEVSGQGIDDLNELELSVQRTVVATLSEFKYTIVQDKDMADSSRELLTNDDLALTISVPGIDSLCYRLNRCPPYSYMLACNAGMRSVNMRYWLPKSEATVLTVHHVNNTLVSIMTEQHRPVFTADLVSALTDMTPTVFFWSPTTSEIDMMKTPKIGVRVINSPTGFGAIDFKIVAQLDDCLVLVPVDYRMPHRWRTIDELCQLFSESVATAIEKAEELVAAWEDIKAEDLPLNLDWSEAVETVRELLEEHHVPTRLLKKHAPEDAPATWAAVVAAILDISESIREQEGNRTLADTIAQTAGSLVMALARNRKE